MFTLCPQRIDRQDQKGSRAARGIEDALVDRSCVGSGTTQHKWISLTSFENVFCEPVGRVVLAEVVSKFTGQQAVIELFQEVPSGKRIVMNRRDVVLGQTPQRQPH